MFGKGSSKAWKHFGKALRPYYLVNLIPFDICWLMNIKAHHSAFYFILTDDYSHYSYIHLLSLLRSIKRFKGFVVEVKNQKREKTKAL